MSELTDLELDEMFLSLSECEQNVIRDDAVDYLCDHTGYLKLSSRDRENAIRAQIRSMMREGEGK